MLPSTSPPISPAPPECELRCTYSRYLLYRTCLPAVLTALDLLAGIPSSRAGRAAATTHNPATHNAARSKRRSRRRHQARDAASADARPPNPCEVPPPSPHLPFVLLSTLPSPQDALAVGSRPTRSARRMVVMVGRHRRGRHREAPSRRNPREAVSRRNRRREAASRRSLREGVSRAV